MWRVDSKVDGRVADAFVGSGDAVRLGLDFQADGVEVRQDGAFVVQELGIFGRVLNELLYSKEIARTDR